MGNRKSTNYLKLFFSLIYRLIVLSLVLILPILCFKYIFRLKDINVTGSSLYTKEEILDTMINSEADKSSVLFYFKYKYIKKVNLPFIEKTEIEMLDLNTINLYLYDKVITGCTEYMGEYMYFDKEGTVVDSSNELYNDIPLIKGLQFNKIILYEKLELPKDELFDVILNLTQQIRLNKIVVDTIEFNRKHEVRLYCGSNKVLLGKELRYDEKIADLSQILIETEEKNLTIDISNLNAIRAIEEKN